MKVTQKEIRLITDAIVSQVYDEQKIREKIDKKLESLWKNFSKSKKWKDTMKLFNLWQQLTWFKWILVNDKDFFWIPNMYGNCDYRITSEAQAKTSYFNWNRANVEREFGYANKGMIVRKVETLLTVKLLCGWDMEKVMDEIIKTIKKEFNL